MNLDGNTVLTTGGGRGIGHGTDPRAMPLPDFISEVTDILRTEPTPLELCVERVRIERDAEGNGDYETVFRQFNDPVEGFFRDRVATTESR